MVNNSIPEIPPILWTTLTPVTKTEEAMKQIIEKILLNYPPHIAPYIARYIESCSSIIHLHLTIKIPKHASSYKPIPVEIIANPVHTSRKNENDNKIIIPNGQIWILTEAYTSQNPSIDGKLQIFKNNYVREPIATLKLSKISVKTQDRMSFSQPIKFGPKEELSIGFVPEKSNKRNSQVIETAGIIAILIDLTYPNLLPADITRVEFSPSPSLLFFLS